MHGRGNYPRLLATGNNPENKTERRTIMKNDVTGYVYDVDTYNVVAEIVGSQTDVEGYVDANYGDDYALTYSPAFGFSGGLTDNDDKDIIYL